MAAGLSNGDSWATSITILNILLELINNILDLSRIESGKVELRPEIFPASEAFREVVASVRPTALGKSIQIETLVAEEHVLQADRVRFKEILFNLMSNALKFTPPIAVNPIVCATPVVIRITTSVNQ